jgi:GT2 family glycosyltransferase
VISAIIPTCRGATRLARHLPGVIGSLRAVGEGFEVIVVDDGGGGLDPLPEGARVLSLEHGLGYGPAVNAGARQARGEHLLILNDDVGLEPATVTLLRRRFPEPGLFAVVPSIRSPLARCGDEGGKVGVFRAGELEIEEASAEQDHGTLYPVGCCLLCPRALYLELGGYDELFAPFFWEDVDLGYRAWRRGLRIRHVPEAVCHHEGSATLSERYPLETRIRAEFRNRVLFHLRNLQSRERRAGQVGAWIAHALLDGRPERRQGLVEALERLGDLGPRGEAGLSDDEIVARAR